MRRRHENPGRRPFSGEKSGLGDAISLLRSIPRVGHVRFTHSDVVRHDLVRQIVEAYERASREGQPTAAK